MSDRIETYLNIAGEQIRWKRARPALLEELRTHLLDQRDSCLAEGMSEEEAQAEAVRQMGDAVSVGLGLDRVHRPKPQWGLLLLTVAVAVAGVVFRLVLTAGDEWPTASVGVWETVLALVLGIGVLFIGYFLDYTFLGYHGKRIYLAALVLGVAMVALETVGFYDMSYLAAFYPLVYAGWLYSWRGRGWKGFLCSIFGMIPLLVVRCVSGDSGLMFDLLVLLVTGVLLLMLLSWKDWYGIGRKAGIGILNTGILFVGGWGCVRVLSSDYMSNRLLYGFRPELDPTGYGYTGVNIHQALESARWMGEGLWAGAYPYEMMLPGGQEDFLLTTMIHKLGWGPFLALILAFFLLTICLLIKCLRQKNTLAKLTVLAVVMPLAFRTLVALGMNFGVVILFAHFPLFSGNMALVMDMYLIGMVLSVFRQEKLPITARKTQRTYFGFGQ